MKQLINYLIFIS